MLIIFAKKHIMSQFADNYKKEQTDGKHLSAKTYVKTNFCCRAGGKY